MYTRLPPEPQREEPHVEVFPDTQEGDSKRGLSNYLDEFLSAIKVFGYLERPVFHELTRTMQTRKLIAGETLLLEEEKGFCLVVDGLVQIFVKSNRDESSYDSGVSGSSSDDDDGDARGHQQGYQLLTEVKNGAPMSSLFSILSLFTEDIKLRHDEDDQGIDSAPPTAGGPRFSRADSQPLTGTMTPQSENFPSSPQQMPQMSPRSGLRQARRASTMTSPTSSGRLPRVPSLSLDTDQDQDLEQETTKSRKQSESRSRAQLKSAHPDIVARATVDTTIAIIPATAFKRLTRIYPRATAHIIQVILTRLQRVTLSTGHAYLGLTSEVLRIERLMNKYTTYDLPGFLKDAALQRLKDKFAKERERIGDEDGMKGIALHNPATHRKRSGSGLRREVHTRLASIRPTSAAPIEPAPRRSATMSPQEQDRQGVSAGKLNWMAFWGVTYTV